MPKRLPCPPDQNNLIATLSDADRALVDPHLDPVALPHRLMLEEPNRPIETVYFPVAGIGSIIAKGNEGRSIEVGLFGREGMSGTAVVLESGFSPHETVIQVAGHGFRIGAGLLHDLTEESPSLRRHLLHYTQTLMTQTDHTALANGRATLEIRLARWLLMCHDRIDGDTIRLTHEFLAVMLGARRAGVTVGTQILEGEGLIQARRGQITIRDRDALEAKAGEFYGLPAAEYARLIGPVATNSSKAAASQHLPSNGGIKRP